MNKAAEGIGDPEMSYTANSQINPAVAEREIEMLRAGRSYADVAATLGTRLRSVSERNRLVYRIDIKAAFAARIEREGIPVRLAVSDAFGYWFSGFFDGEGCLTVFSRPKAGTPYVDRRLDIQVMLRDDEADVIRHIKDNLGAGLTYFGKGNRPTNPKATFRVEKIDDLAEIVVPLFERYPLHSKKGREFAIWKGLVRTQYLVTLGGYSQRAAATEAQKAAFDAGREAIRQIRTCRPSLTGERIAEVQEEGAVIS